MMKKRKSLRRIIEERFTEDEVLSFVVVVTAIACMCAVFVILLLADALPEWMGF